jgi:hypothetical protein
MGLGATTTARSPSSPTAEDLMLDDRYNVQVVPTMT